MSGVIVSVLAFAVLFAGFALMSRGRESGGCDSCGDGCKYPDGTNPHCTRSRELR